MNNEPITITVGEYELQIHDDRIVLYRIRGGVAAPILMHAGLIAALARALTSERKKTEAAFREGYDAGYHNAVTDAGTFAFGGGSKRGAALLKDQDDAWRDSDAALPCSETQA